MQQKVHSMDLKLKTVEQYEKGLLQTTVSRLFNIHKSIVSEMIQKQHRDTVTTKVHCGRPQERK